MVLKEISLFCYIVDIINIIFVFRETTKFHLKTKSGPFLSFVETKQFLLKDKITIIFVFRGDTDFLLKDKTRHFFVLS
jgi:hypothetical protein